MDPPPSRIRLQVHVYSVSAGPGDRPVSSFIEVASPDISLEELSLAISNRHRRLYPHKPPLNIYKIQDSECNDLDLSYLVSDIFSDKTANKDASVVRVVQSPLYREASIPPDSGLRSQQWQPYPRPFQTRNRLGDIDEEHGFAVSPQHSRSQLRKSIEDRMVVDDSADERDGDRSTSGRGNQRRSEGRDGSQQMVVPETSPPRLSPELGEVARSGRASVEITGTQVREGGLDRAEDVKEEPLSPVQEEDMVDLHRTEFEPESELGRLEPEDEPEGEAPTITPRPTAKLTPGGTSITRNKAGRAVFNPTPTASPTNIRRSSSITQPQSRKKDVYDLPTTDEDEPLDYTLSQSATRRKWAPSASSARRSASGTPKGQESSKKTPKTYGSGWRSFAVTNSSPPPPAPQFQPSQQDADGDVDMDRAPTPPSTRPVKQVARMEKPSASGLPLEAAIERRELEEQMRLQRMESQDRSLEELASSQAARKKGTRRTKPATEKQEKKRKKEQEANKLWKQMESERLKREKEEAFRRVSEQIEKSKEFAAFVEANPNFKPQSQPDSSTPTASQTKKRAHSTIGTPVASSTPNGASAKRVRTRSPSATPKDVDKAPPPAPNSSVKRSSLRQDSSVPRERQLSVSFAADLEMSSQILPDSSFLQATPTPAAPPKKNTPILPPPYNPKTTKSAPKSASTAVDKEPAEDPINGVATSSSNSPAPANTTATPSTTPATAPQKRMRQKKVDTEPAATTPDPYSLPNGAKPKRTHTVKPKVVYKSVEWIGDSDVDSDIDENDANNAVGLLQAQTSAQPQPETSAPEGPVKEQAVTSKTRIEVPTSPVKKPVQQPVVVATAVGEPGKAVDSVPQVTQKETPAPKNTPIVPPKGLTVPKSTTPIIPPKDVSPPKSTPIVPPKESPILKSAPTVPAKESPIPKSTPIVPPKGRAASKTTSPVVTKKPSPTAPVESPLVIANTIQNSTTAGVSKPEESLPPSSAPKSLSKPLASSTSPPPRPTPQPGGRLGSSESESSSEDESEPESEDDKPAAAVTKGSTIEPPTDVQKEATKNSAPTPAVPNAAPVATKSNTTSVPPKATPVAAPTAPKMKQIPAPKPIADVKPTKSSSEEESSESESESESGSESDDSNGPGSALNFLTNRNKNKIPPSGQKPPAPSQPTPAAPQKKSQRVPTLPSSPPQAPLSQGTAARRRLADLDSGPLPDVHDLHKGSQRISQTASKTTSKASGKKPASDSESSDVSSEESDGDSDSDNSNSNSDSDSDSDSESGKKKTNGTKGGIPQHKLASQAKIAEKKKRRSTLGFGSRLLGVGHHYSDVEFGEKKFVVLVER